MDLTQRRKDFATWREPLTLINDRNRSIRAEGWRGENRVLRKLCLPGGF